MSEARARETAKFYTDNPDKARERIEQQARERSKGAPIPKGETFAAYFERWIRDREERGYTSIKSDRSAFTLHVVPTIGEKPIATITREDLERLVQVLDKKIVQGEYSWRSAKKLWLAVHKLFRDASSAKNLALRVRKDNPAQGVVGPDLGTHRSKVYLFPVEFLQLASCEKVPLDMRRLATLAIYLYCRISEILRLRWTDINLSEGVIYIRRSFDNARKQEKGTKTKRPRAFRIEPNLLPLLHALYAERDESGRVIPVYGGHMAQRFRAAMQTAGLDRPDLYIADDLHKRMTFHDLRATGITWMAMRGDSTHVIMQRAGHQNFNSTLIYIREGEALRGNVGEVFPPLPACLLVPAGEGSAGGGNLSENDRGGTTPTSQVSVKSGESERGAYCSRYYSSSIRTAVYFADRGCRAASSFTWSILPTCGICISLISARADEVRPPRASQAPAGVEARPPKIRAAQLVPVGSEAREAFERVRVPHLLFPPSSIRDRRPWTIALATGAPGVSQ
ncbi:tyrosine-type recombinase/integrase [Polyangium jinanense]|uniref:Tyrosine-type recombinase/integrase n=1 Tax=Polyangium jinanense TaxID=2829994 RepID=A0A9X3XJ28_9BACT|nr:site-specific integrase [Polyangium jinanense]MDC3989011.1 tyrosine-type recombinase/integrase [Polyangium jinanense]